MLDCVETADTEQNIQELYELKKGKEVVGLVI